MKRNHENRIDRLELAFIRNGVFETSLERQNDDVLTIPTTCSCPVWEPEDDIYIPTGEEIIPEPPDWLPPFDDNDALAWLSPIRGENDDEAETATGGFRIGDWWFIRDDSPFRNSPYKHNYRVIKLDGYVTLGHVYYQTYLLNRDYIYLRLSNKCLYSGDVWTLIHKFRTDFSLQMRYVSKLDIAIDSAVDVGNTLYEKMRNDLSITWVVNGRKIYDRDASIKNLFWVASGTLNDPTKNKSLYVKQEQGFTQVSYDKTLEISESSGKRYQIDSSREPELWSTDGYIFRNEIRLDRMCIIKYIDNRGINDEELFDLIQSSQYRDAMFALLTQRLIRWWEKGKLTNIADLILKDRNDSVDGKDQQDGEHILLPASLVNDTASQETGKISAKKQS